MKKILIPICLLIHCIAFGQENLIKSVSEPICIHIGSNDWDAPSLNALVVEFLQLGQELSIEDPQIKERLAENYKLEDADFNEDEALKSIMLEITYELIENCPAYVEVARNFIDPLINKNQSLKSITNDIEKDFENYIDLSYADQITKSDESIFPIILNYESQLERDYEYGLADPRFNDDLLRYLFHKSDVYFKAVLGNKARQLYR